mmetsp:Transcript_8585/g.11859  ORF Transcript_8585/g.11859 Transcript_8585/m.11859 type:complete len:101 (+) Transcript_8585:178-480(+)
MLAHVLLVVVSTALSGSAGAHTPTVLIAARCVLRGYLEAFGVDLVMREAIDSVFLLRGKALLKLIDFARAPIVLGTVVLDQLVQAQVAWSFFQGGARAWV